MKKMKYAVLSGEGELGTWDVTRPITERGIRRILTRERVGGDRWAKAYALISPGWPNVGTDLETGEARELPMGIVKLLLA